MTKPNKTISQLTVQEKGVLTERLVQILKRDGQLATIEIKKMNNSRATEYVMGDLYRHDFVKSYVLFDREEDRPADTMCYRLFWVTDKFRNYIRNGREKEIY